MLILITISIIVIPVCGDFFEDLVLEQTVDLSFIKILPNQIGLATTAILSFGFDSVANTYELVRPVPSWVLEEFFTSVFKRKALSANSLVLEAGIGPGRTISPLMAMGIPVIGIDVSRNMLIKAAEKMKTTFPQGNQAILIRGDITHLPFRPNSFDMVVTVNVLWLIPRWKSAISELRRVIKPDGVLVTATHRSPEFGVPGLGPKCWKLEEKAFGYNKPLLSRLQIIDRTLILKQIKTIASLKHLNRNGERWELYINGISKSQETSVITWRYNITISALVALFERRLSSLEHKLPYSTIRQFKKDLEDWTNKALEAKQDSDPELTETFTFTITRF